MPQWPVAFCARRRRLAAPPGGPYGRIPVPGSWTDRYSTAVREAEGYKPDYGKLGRTVLAWFRRDVDVPDDMAGHQIVLELKEVSRVARVYVGGKEAGVVDGQGRVDITAHVVPGHKTDIAILVSAAPPLRREGVRQPLCRVMPSSTAA